MVDRAVSYVVLVHQVHDVGYGLRVVGGVAVDFHIENVSAARQLVVRTFDFCLVAGRAFVVDRHMVGVGVVDFVGDAGEYSEALAVFGCELSRQPLCRSGED